MTGCRYGAKNTLVKNYLGLAESAGAQVHPMTTVTGFKQRPDGLWEVKTAHTGRLLRRKRRTFTATHLVLAAGTFGTQKLLFKMRDRGNLPKLSDKLGVLTRTNSESIVGAGRLEVRDDLDLTHGVAITSSIHPTSDTHIEPVRYGKGSNAMGLLQTLMTDGAGPGGTDTPRWRQLLDQAGEDPKKMLRMLNPAHWSERTMIALVMQHLDNSITTYTKRTKLGFRRMVSKQGHGEPNPTWIPVGNEVTRRLAKKIDGVAGGTWGELFNIPLTAHFLGGAAIGDSRRARRDRPVPARVQLPDDVCGRRRVRLGQPRRQPLAEHHRAGRAGGVAVAQQGRGRPAAEAGRGLQAARPDRARASRRTRRRLRRAAAHSVRTGRKGQLDRLNAPDTGYFTGPCVTAYREDLAALRCPVGRYVRTGRRRDGPRVDMPCCRQIWTWPNRSSPTTTISRTSGERLRGARVRLLALQQPVAGDLRKIVGSLHVGADIERMGALAVHVANIARLRHPEQALPDEVRESFTEMSHVAVQLARTAREVLLSPDAEKAAQLREKDDVVDTRHRQLFAVLIDREWRSGVCSAVDVALLGRFYERFADHAVEIGRRVVFEATGGLPMHKKLA